MRRISYLLATMAFAVTANAQTSGTQNSTITPINVSMTCATTGKTATFNLGTLAASLSFGGVGDNPPQGFGNFDDVLTVDQTSNAQLRASFFSCFALHFVQVVTAGVAPATYMGVAAPQPIIDVPNGGWDYMYPGGNRSMNPLAEYANWVTATDKHAQPWYYNTTVGEPAFDTIGSRYELQDGPAIRGSGTLLSFSTYLVVTPTANAAVGPGALAPGGFEVLGGFDWSLLYTAGFGGTPLKRTLTLGPSNVNAGAITTIQTSLLNAQYNTAKQTNWTAYAYGANGSPTLLCNCVPEPSPIAALGLGLGCACVLRRRRRARAA